MCRAVSLLLRDSHGVRDPTIRLPITNLLRTADARTFAFRICDFRLTMRGSVMPNSNYKLVRLANGTFSIHSLAENETFHPVVGPVAEAQALYINQLKLRQRLQAHAGEFVIWDVGLGAGGNVLAVFAATADLACPLRVVSFDRTTEALRFALEHAAALGYVEPYRGPAQDFLSHGRAAFRNGAQSVRWELQLGDFPAFLRRAPSAARAARHPV